MNVTTKNLAGLVFQKLQGITTFSMQLSEAVLTDLFETLFFTSLKTEEGQLLKVTVTLISSANPDPNPPRRQVAHRWNYIRFKEPLPCTVANLAKLAKAADPLSSSLAVDCDAAGALFIWGMIDQSGHYQSVLNYEASAGTEQPGLFHASIDGIGCVSVMLDYQLIASLRQNALASDYVDVFSGGPIRQLLTRQAAEYRQPIEQHILAEFGQEYGADLLREWNGYLENVMTESVCRILLRMQGYHHGGAFLITADGERDLDIKHQVSYDRLTKSISNYVKFAIANRSYSTAIVDDFLENGQETVPTLLYVGEDASQFGKEETSYELKGAISFIASLSCIDGLVVLSPGLHVQGFGAVIRNLQPPPVVHVAHQAEVAGQALPAISPDHFGTRHRSMFSYCWNNAGSLGFVVSQDGDIRAIARVGEQLVMWDNIRVQQFARSSKQPGLVPRLPKAPGPPVQR